MSARDPPPSLPADGCALSLFFPPPRPRPQPDALLRIVFPDVRVGKGGWFGGPRRSRGVCYAPPSVFWATLPLFPPSGELPFPPLAPLDTDENALVEQRSFEDIYSADSFSLSLLSPPFLLTGSARAGWVVFARTMTTTLLSFRPSQRCDIELRYIKTGMRPCARSSFESHWRGKGPHRPMGQSRMHAPTHTRALGNRIFFENASGAFPLGGIGKVGVRPPVLALLSFSPASLTARIDFVLRSVLGRTWVYIRPSDDDDPSLVLSVAAR